MCFEESDKIFSIPYFSTKTVRLLLKVTDHFPFSAFAYSATLRDREKKEREEENVEKRATTRKSDIFHEEKKKKKEREENKSEYRANVRNDP